jgi:hypothetical protein
VSGSGLISAFLAACLVLAPLDELHRLGFTGSVRVGREADATDGIAPPPPFLFAVDAAAIVAIAHEHEGNIHAPLDDDVAYDGPHALRIVGEGSDATAGSLRARAPDRSTIADLGELLGIIGGVFLPPTAGAELILTLVAEPREAPSLWAASRLLEGMATELERSSSALLALVSVEGRKAVASGASGGPTGVLAHVKSMGSSITAVAQEVVPAQCLILRNATADSPETDAASEDPAQERSRMLTAVEASRLLSTAVAACGHPAIIFLAAALPPLLALSTFEASSSAASSSPSMSAAVGSRAALADAAAASLSLIAAVTQTTPSREREAASRFIGLPRVTTDPVLAHGTAARRAAGETMSIVIRGVGQTAPSALMRTLDSDPKLHALVARNSGALADGLVASLRSAATLHAVAPFAHGRTGALAVAAEAGSRAGDTALLLTPPPTDIATAPSVVDALATTLAAESLEVVGRALAALPPMPPERAAQGVWDALVSSRLVPHPRSGAPGPSLPLLDDVSAALVVATRALAAGEDGAARSVDLSASLTRGASSLLLALGAVAHDITARAEPLAAADAAAAVASAPFLGDDAAFSTGAAAATIAAALGEELPPAIATAPSPRAPLAARLAERAALLRRLAAPASAPHPRPQPSAPPPRPAADAAVAAAISCLPWLPEAARAIVQRLAHMAAAHLGAAAAAVAGAAGRRAGDDGAELLGGVPLPQLRLTAASLCLFADSAVALARHPATLHPLLADSWESITPLLPPAGLAQALLDALAETRGARRRSIGDARFVRCLVPDGRAATAEGMAALAEGLHAAAVAASAPAVGGRGAGVPAPAPLPPGEALIAETRAFLARRAALLRRPAAPASSSTSPRGAAPRRVEARISLLPAVSAEEEARAKAAAAARPIVELGGGSHGSGVGNALRAAPLSALAAAAARAPAALAVHAAAIELVTLLIAPPEVAPPSGAEGEGGAPATLASLVSAALAGSPLSAAARLVDRGAAAGDFLRGRFTQEVWPALRAVLAALALDAAAVWGDARREAAKAGVDVAAVEGAAKAAAGEHEEASGGRRAASASVPPPSLAPAHALGWTALRAVRRLSRPLVLVERPQGRETVDAGDDDDE